MDAFASGEAQRRVETLMLEFREFLFEIEEERKNLRSKINNLSKLRRQQNQQLQQHSQTTAHTTTTTITPPTSTSDSSQSVTTTTDKTESTKPPSYRTAVPQPPARTKRKSTSSLTQLPTIPMSSTMSGRGALIVLEGLDRVGKSTLANKLMQHLERIQRPVAHMRFPDRTTDSGQLINKQLKEKSGELMTQKLHLLFSLNRWEQDQKIRDTLNRGVSIIVDRYSYSGIAYSCAQGNLKMGWCCNIETGLPKPDLVIYLELPEQAQIRRPGYGDERFENTEYQKLVRQQYEKLMTISHEDWLRVDVENKGPDQVLAEIISPVHKCLNSCANKAIGDLSFIQ